LIGDWGLGIGDWAQSPIPNPQSPFILIIRNIKLHSKNKYKDNNFYFITLLIYSKILIILNNKKIL